MITEIEREETKDGRRSFLKRAMGVSAGLLAGMGLPMGLTTLRAQEDVSPGSTYNPIWRSTTCQGCTSWCPSQIKIQDGRAVRCRGNEHSMVNGKNNCVRMNMSLQQMYDPDRIKRPMRRTNPEKGRGVDPEFVPISWDEAISEIADRIMELRDNGEIHKFMLTRGRYTYLRHILYGSLPKILGSPNNISHSAICAEAEKFGPYYTEGEWSYRQYDVLNSRYVLIWGADPVVSNRQVSHYNSAWGDVMDRAEVAVVEPRLNTTASKADEFLPVKPGEDGAVASAMAHVILTEGLWYRDFVGDFYDGTNRFKAGETVSEDAFRESENSTGLVRWWNLELNDKTPEWAEERSGVSADQIRRVARRFADAAPRAISWVGGGPVMQPRGAYTSMATHALNGLVGSVGNRGGTLFSPPIGVADLPDPSPYVDEVAQAGLDYPKHHGTGDKIDQRGAKDLPSLKGGKSGGGVVTNRAADGILQEDPMEIKMLISYWSNFPFSCQETRRWEEALAKIPFHVTIETHASETAYFADIILPATHHMYERWGQVHTTGNRRRTVSINRPVFAENPSDPEDVLENGRLWNVKCSETEVPYLIADELAGRGFTNMLDFFENEFPDPETGLSPADEYDDRELRAQAFSRNALKLRTQPMWDPEVACPPGDDIDGWEEFVRRGVWNSAEWEDRHRWPSEGGAFKTKTGKFEFYSETLKDALEGHAARYDTDVDDILETCNYQARGERAFVPHYEEPFIHGDPEEYPFKFVDHKSKLNREGRSANCSWYYELNDVNPGALLGGADVALLNPRDARRLGIKTGDRVRVESPVGSIECYAAEWEGVQPGTLAKTFGKGHWAYGNEASAEFGKKAHGGNNNALIPADYDRLSGSSARHGTTRVRVVNA